MFMKLNGAGLIEFTSIVILLTLLEQQKGRILH
jgi:hypothetical protein